MGELHKENHNCCLFATQTLIQGIPLRKIYALALISYSQHPLGVTCPIFSDDAFYFEAGIHHGIAAVKPEFFDGDDSVEAAVLSQLK